jgi:hypothetical protein
MQHYLRNALLTLLADEQPLTILELIRVLTDDAFRERFVRQLRDPMIRSFWETQWPGRGERERDTSIKAVLYKLGAFVTYDSIRAVVGQGTSTIRPRDVMDRGEVLLVDLSGVGGDNATLFGAMLASRYSGEHAPYEPTQLRLDDTRFLEHSGQALSEGLPVRRLEPISNKA